VDALNDEVQLKPHWRGTGLILPFTSRYRTVHMALQPPQVRQ